MCKVYNAESATQCIACETAKPGAAAAAAAPAAFSFTFGGAPVATSEPAAVGKAEQEQEAKVDQGQVTAQSGGPQSPSQEAGTRIGCIFL